MLRSKMDGRMTLVCSGCAKGYSHTKKDFVPFPTSTYPENQLGPNELDPGISEKFPMGLIVERFLWPDAHVVPFHYRKLDYRTLIDVQRIRLRASGLRRKKESL